MRLILVVLLWVSLSFQCLVQLGIAGWYEVNKQVITEKYCVNKDKVQLHCNGKCHLKKQLDKTGGEQSENKGNKQTEWIAFICPEKFVPVEQCCFAAPVEQPLAKYCTYSFLFLHTVFHPPQMV